jgi:hypothetical protein
VTVINPSQALEKGKGKRPMASMRAAGAKKEEKATAPAQDINAEDGDATKGKRKSKRPVNENAVRTGSVSFIQLVHYASTDITRLEYVLKMQISPGAGMHWTARVGL